LRVLLGALAAWVLTCSAAGAQVHDLTWDDPTFAEAVRTADVVVLATAAAVATNGAAYRVDASFKGPAVKGTLLAVTGLHHPRLRERPPVAEGDQAYLLLRGDPKGEGFTLPTPTYGRFTRRKTGEQEGARDEVVLSMGGSGTFARFPVTVKRFEALVNGVVGGKAPKLLAKSREELVGSLTDPGATTPETLYLAIEVIGLFGERSDAAKCLALLREVQFRDEPHVHVRIAAARALGRLGGPRGARELLRVVSKDPAAAVRSIAFASVASALSGKQDPRIVRLACQKLAELAPAQDPEPIRFGTARDPRKNAVDSPFDACLRTLARLESRLGIPIALKALEGENLNAIIAGLAYFSALGDADQAGGIVTRMRPEDSVDAFVNRLFARMLAGLTGQDLGVERAAWLKWWAAREDSKRPAGPQREGGK
jgi:hypothetical protein